MTMKTKKNTISSALFLIICIGFGVFLSGQGANPSVVSTFHCLGIEWSPAGGGAAVDCRVQYRLWGAAAWKDAMSLWYDAADGEYRGSIVNLIPGATYEIRLSLTGTSIEAAFAASTWSEDFPIAQTVTVTNSNQKLVINQSGSPSGYILYAPTPGDTAVIDVNNAQSSCVEFASGVHHVIIRGLTLQGATDHGIDFLGSGCHDVVIEQCDISDWGHGAAYEGAIYGYGVERIVVQRNKIHHPRYDSNSWQEPPGSGQPSGHPHGPIGVHFEYGGGNLVIRYNEFYSDADHYFFDILQGGADSFDDQFPVHDSDIYGNHLANCWDDAIQAEGGNVNVRIWGNYIEHFFVAIAAAPCTRGPLYIWRNVTGASRYSLRSPNSDDYGRGEMIKAGWDQFEAHGKVYVFHNTTLQPLPPPGQTLPLGVGVSIKDGGGSIYEYTARNNIFTNYKRSWVFKDGSNSCTNDLDYDIYHGTLYNDCSARPHESHGVVIPGFPQYDPANCPMEFYLIPGSPGIDAGLILPNFNDDFIGGAPDIGAYETGRPPLEFGIHAYESAPASQSILLTPGWNWISFNLLPADRSLDTIFGGIIGQMEQVRTQTQSALRLNGQWVGDLASMEGIQTGKMYKVRVNAACTLTVSGTRILSSPPISLVGGWNWVAYYPGSPMPTGNALQSIAGQVQQVRSQTQSAISTNGQWMGDLAQLEPGKGYTILMTGPGALSYPGGE